MLHEMTTLTTQNQVRIYEVLMIVIVMVVMIMILMMIVMMIMLMMIVIIIVLMLVMMVVMIVIVDSDSEYLLPSDHVSQVDDRGHVLHRGVPHQQAKSGAVVSLHQVVPDLHRQSDRQTDRQTVNQ
jgi:hypothetical protein